METMERKSESGRLSHNWNGGNVYAHGGSEKACLFLLSNGVELLEILLTVRWRMAVCILGFIHTAFVALRLFSDCPSDDGSRSSSSYGNSHTGHNH
jgi:hypothetical protein